MIGLCADVTDVGVALVQFGKRADAVRGQKLLLIEEVVQSAFETVTRRNGQQTLGMVVCLLGFHIRDVPSQVLAVIKEPLQALGETRQALKDLSVKDFHGHEGN
jgi:hypothetical protein